MPHPFLALQEEYVHRLATLKITRPAAAEKRARELIKPSVLDHFVPVNQKLGIPIVWMVCSFNRESDCDFTRSPAQGDRWDEVSTHVPRGVGPFPSFEASAEWAYRHDGIERNSFPWTFAYACYTWEEFNGFGPRNHGHVSGYVFAGTDQYDPPSGLGGKYVEDGVWSPTTVDRQLGCVPLAMMMIELEPSLAFVADVGAPAVVPPLPIVVMPPPIGVGGDPEGHRARRRMDTTGAQRIAYRGDSPRGRRQLWSRHPQCGAGVPSRSRSRSRWLSRPVDDCGVGGGSGRCVTKPANVALQDAI
jgi:lysozyme family protein